MNTIVTAIRNWYRPRRKAFAAAAVPAASYVSARLGLPDELAVLLAIAVTPIVVYAAPNTPSAP